MTVKQSIYLNILYLRMCVQKLFHLCWINIFSSTNNKILQKRIKLIKEKEINCYLAYRGNER